MIDFNGEAVNLDYDLERQCLANGLPAGWVAARGGAGSG